MRLTLVCLLAAALVTGCSPESEPPEPAQSTAELEELRQEYGLPDCPETDPQTPGIDGGLPQTSLPCLGSTKQVNLADLAGEPMVINLWAQWCEPCRAEAPHLRKAAEESGVMFLGIDYEDPRPDLALEFAHTVKWPYPHVTDVDTTLKGTLIVPGLPTTVFIAADGTIAGRHAGQLESHQQLESLMEEYLGT